MSAAHTPGPWPIERTGDGKRIIVGPGLIEGPHGYDIAEVYSDDCDPEEATANARLIAAAPELLEALEKLAAFADEVTGKVEPPLPALARAWEAIAKARGEA